MLGMAGWQDGRMKEGSKGRGGEEEAGIVGYRKVLKRAQQGWREGERMEGEREGSLVKIKIR